MIIQLINSYANAINNNNRIIPNHINIDNGRGEGAPAGSRTSSAAGSSGARRRRLFRLVQTYYIDIRLYLRLCDCL